MPSDILTFVSKENYKPVQDTEQHSGTRDPDPFAEQLDFSFDDVDFEPDIRIFLVPMDDMHGGRLCETLDTIRPKLVLDLRYVIRFDLPGTSRTQVFKRFHSLQTLYIKDSLPWHDMERRDFIAGDVSISHRLRHEVVERDQTPILIFVPKIEHVRYLGSYLNRILAPQSKKTWEVVSAV